IAPHVVGDGEAFAAWAGDLGPWWVVDLAAAPGPPGALLAASAPVVDAEPCPAVRFLGGGHVAVVVPLRHEPDAAVDAGGVLLGRPDAAGAARCCHYAATPRRWSAASR